MKKRAAKRKTKRNKGEDDMQLVQIGKTEAPKTVTVREMFLQLAEKEERMIREAREQLTKKIPTSA